MKTQTYSFNVNYLDDIYGAEATCYGDTYHCWRTKYKIGLIYQPKIKKALERELLFNSVFCKRFMAGEIVFLRTASEKEAMRQRGRNLAEIQKKRAKNPLSQN